MNRLEQHQVPAYPRVQSPQARLLVEQKGLEPGMVVRVGLQQDLSHAFFEHGSAERSGYDPKPVASSTPAAPIRVPRLSGKR